MIATILIAHLFHLHFFILSLYSMLFSLIIFNILRIKLLSFIALFASIIFWKMFIIDFNGYFEIF